MDGNDNHPSRATKPRESSRVLNRQAVSFTSCLTNDAESGGLPGRLLAFGQDMAGDDDLLDLAGAVVDLGHLGVAEIAFDVVPFQVATTAENLDGVRRV